MAEAIVFPAAPGPFSECAVVSYKDESAGGASAGKKRLLGAANPLSAADAVRTQTWIVRSASATNVTYAVKQTLLGSGEVELCSYTPNRVLATLEKGKSEAAFRAAMTAKGLTVKYELMKDSNGNSVFVVEAEDTENDVVETMTASIQSTGFCGEKIYRNTVYSVCSSPNDTAWSDQWNMVKIGAPEAWDATTDASGVTVAVLDTGINYNHYDLNENLWTNPGEVDRGSNGSDDDGNGIVDDIYGMQCIGGNISGNPMDDLGHGSHCAGIIGAVGNNMLGVAGVAWSAKIMALKFCDSSGNGSLEDVIRCLNYAEDKGARVVNCSWITKGQWDDLLGERIKSLGNKGVIFVCAAGNASKGEAPVDLDNEGPPTYPACFTYSNIVSVAATDADDKLASFSFWGERAVDIAAPGVDIYSTVLGGMGFKNDSGTSMAAPHVTGALALLMAYYPDESSYALVQKLYDCGEPLESLRGYVKTGKRLSLKGLFGLRAPSGADVTASLGTSSEAVSIYWNAVAGATFYRVWRAESADGEKTMLRDWHAGLTFNDTTADPEKQYYYFIQAASSSTGASASPFSSGVIGYRAAASTAVKVTFDAAGGNVATASASYELGETYGELPTPTCAGKVFLGWYTEATGGTRIDASCAVRAEVTGLFAHWIADNSPRIENLFARQRYPWNGSVDISFTLAGLEDNYAADVSLSARSSDGKTSTPLKSWVGDGPDNLLNGMHQFVWNSVPDVGNTLNTNISLVATLTTRALKPSSPTSVTAQSGASTTGTTISWGAVDGATGYDVYRGTSDDPASAQLLDSTSSTSYTDTTGTPGLPYYYWVVASNAAVKSDFSASVVGFRKLSEPTNVSATDGTYADKVAVSWSAVNGATTYSVYRNTSSSSASATQIGTTASTNYDDTSATPGTTYWYWVRACRSDNQQTGDFSVGDTGFRSVPTPSVAATYLVVDLSGGPTAEYYPVSELDSVPNGGWTDEYKTNKLVLRRIANGSFTMGSPSGEVGRGDDETQHSVTISMPFYMGVFEVTQKQYELVMGSNPSYTKGDARPVEDLSYNTIRGSSEGAEWPLANTVDSASFMGKIRARTGLAFDLPTEAQWEYACRAGTTTTLNSGKNMTSTDQDSEMDEVGRYGYNSGHQGGTKDGMGGYRDYHTTVGSYEPNSWGLYDMHGNVWEWCLDWYQSSLGALAETDPKGGVSGSGRVTRGGGWCSIAHFCRSANRDYFSPLKTTNAYGFRLCCPAGEATDQVAVTFNANGGTGTMSSVCVGNGGSMVLPECTYCKGGCVFSGWATSSSGSVVYEAGATIPSVTSALTLYAKWATPSKTYLVVDFSGGTTAANYPLSELDDVPSGGWTDEYKTTKLVLRRIANGSFTMGARSTDYPGATNFYLHDVTISKPFYLGVFEVTQKQYELVTGRNPSSYKGDARPVECVSYDEIRGSSEGAKWPLENSVDSTSFMGKIQARTGLTFDLPTEAQWEYACRAGTTTALNSGKNLTSLSQASAMDEVGRYGYNNGYAGGTQDGMGGYSDYHTTVGSYRVNDWGLYDMHGNVCEWCLDKYQSSLGTSAVTDPKGASSGSTCVIRGGGWYAIAALCRSAQRDYIKPSSGSESLGFRICCPAEPATGIVTVSFNVNGGSGAMPPVTIGSGKTMVVPECAFYKSGYVFAGWATSSSGSVVYEAGATIPSVTSALTLYAKWAAPSKTYLVVDLAGGSEANGYPMSELATEPSGGWADEYKTNKLVLRRIANGSYMMGCESTEVGCAGNEARHQVTISNPFYMGVFEVTQRQYELVMGSKPSYFSNASYYATRPVENVSYDTIRGSSDGAKWPSANTVDATSFMGKIRARTGLSFDMPTEAQWEYACRAGTTTALNSGKNLTSTGSDLNLNEVGRYYYNFPCGSTRYSSSSDLTAGTAAVGSYKPNNWGLYDMHGNVLEWCLDWYTVSLGKSAVTDPKGVASGSRRMDRGGGFSSNAQGCRSASRHGYYDPSHADSSHGFRLCCPAGEATDQVTVSFNANGGSGTMAAASTGRGGSFVIPKVAFARSGYAFGGWATSASGGVVYADGATIAAVTSDLVLYAKWRANAPVAPTDVSASSGEYTDSAIVSWVDGGGGIIYYVYRNTVNDSSTATLLGSIANTAYRDVTGTPGTQYYYWVKAYNDGGYSDFSAGVPGYRKLSAPSGVSASDGTSTSGTTISWSSVSGATKYYVYRYKSDSSSYATSIGSTSSTSYTDTTGTAGTTYYYWVKAYSSSSASYSDFSASDSGWRMADAYTSDYLVVDLSSGATASVYPVSGLNEIPAGGWTEEYKTTKLVLKKIPAGTFWMGCPDDEATKLNIQTSKGVCCRRSVQLTHPMYMGVFEVTQKQWELVMGTRPSHFKNDLCYSCRPVECVSYSMIRGESLGCSWPTNSDVDAQSFIGRMRARSGCLEFDLPTEAEWEYACRAGSPAAFNNGASLVGTVESGFVNQDFGMDQVGRYRYGTAATYAEMQDKNADLTCGTATVGSYLPNAWGLYDMHGNVWECCLDWFVYDCRVLTTVDPVGVLWKDTKQGEYSGRVMRGGNFLCGASSCCCDFRSSTGPKSTGIGSPGLRLALRGLPKPRSSVTVAFDGNGGESVVSEQVYESGSCYASLPLAVRRGYAFLGWYTASSGGQPVSEVTVVGTADLTLYAHWKIQDEDDYSLSTALDNNSQTFTTGGDTPYWYGQGSKTADGTDAARSGAISDNQKTWFETTVSGSGTLTFKWFVSSESDCDCLEYFVDGALVTSISGTDMTSWATVTKTISGSGAHTIRWQYRKDVSLSKGDDAGFVDQVTWTTGAPVQSLAAPTGVSATDGTSAIETIVSWLPVSGAEKYYLYRSCSPDVNTAFNLGWTTATSYGDRSGEVGTTYYYWVRAESGTDMSDFSAYDSGWRKAKGIVPNVPTGLTCTMNRSDGILLTWNPVAGATWYEVYRCNSQFGVYLSIGGTDGTSYLNDSSVSPGVTYYYKITAMSSEGESDQTPAVEGKRK